MPTSLWSEISWRGLARHARQDGEPLTTVSAREQERIVALSSGVAGASNIATQPPNSPDLENLIRKRREWWRSHLDRRAMYNLGLWGHFLTVCDERKWFTPSAILLGGLAVFLLIIDSMQRSPGAVSNLAIIAVMFALYALTAVAILLRAAWRERRLSKWLATHRCSCCAARPKFESPSAEPSRCQSCNLDWPLVPPPIPAAAIAPVRPSEDTPPKEPHDAWHAFSPRRGPRPAAWDVIGPAVSAVDPPRLRIDDRVKPLFIALPRFGRRPSVMPRQWTTTLALMGTFGLMAAWLGRDFATQLLILSGGVMLPIMAWINPNAWRYGAFRRARCESFDAALSGEMAPERLSGVIVQRRSAENLQLMDDRLRANSGKLHSRSDRLIASLPLTIYFGAVGTSGLLRGLIPTAFPPGQSALEGLICPGVLVAGAAMLFVSRRIANRKTNLLAAMGTTRCCTCNYDLAGIPDAIPPESLGGLTTGPAHCPECSSPWPLIPPKAT